VTDQRRKPPTPRPRRRRTDIDPNAPSPPVTRERRVGTPWTGSAAPPPAAGIDVPPAAAFAASAGLARAIADEGHEATRFHVPGLAAAVASEPTRAEETATDEASTGVALDDTPSWLHSREDRSVDPVICPFLRAAGAGGLMTPITSPDPANRCAALAGAVPQSLRQQELVCLSMSHVNCPRYLRGTSVAAAAQPAPVVRAGRTVSPAMLASLVVLVFALTASIGFVLARGDGASISPDGPSSSASVVAVVSPAAVTSVAPSIAPSVVVGTPSATPTASPSPSATPTPTPTPEPTVRRTPRPTPESDRYRLLESCGTRCWVYRVRPGDNLFSIARYFGVPLRSIYARNPWVRSTGLRAGQELRLPPPTR
jgi:hypothetical protein